MVRNSPSALLRLASAALWVNLAAAGSACTSREGDDAGAELSGPKGSVSLLQIERFLDSEGGSLRVVVGAKVARYRGLDGDSLLRLLGTQPVDVGSCMLTGRLSAEPLSADAQVELLSVGDIALRNPFAATTLVPRLFPALSTTAAGWFYAADAELPAPRAELDEFTVRAPGELGVGAFEVVIAAPAELSGLSLGGLPIDRVDGIPRDAALALTWDADDPRDRVEVELLSGGIALSCAARDAGQFTLTVAQLTALEADENATLIVRRVRGTSFDMQGIDASYARVATTRSATLAVR